MTDTGPMMTRTDVARDLACSRATVSNLLRDGRLFGIKIGSDWRIPTEAVEAFKRGDTVTYARKDTPWEDPDVTTWPPTPSLLDDTDPDPQATDDRQALDAAAALVSDDEQAAIIRPNPPMDPTTGHPLPVTT